MRIFKVDKYLIRKDKKNTIAVWKTKDDFTLVYSNTHHNVGNIHKLPRTVKNVILKEII